MSVTSSLQVVKDVVDARDIVLARRSPASQQCNRIGRAKFVRTATRQAISPYRFIWTASIFNHNVNIQCAILERLKSRNRQRPMSVLTLSSHNELPCIHSDSATH